MIFLPCKRREYFSRHINALLVVVALVVAGCAPATTPTDSSVTSLEDRVELLFDSAETQHPNASVDLDTVQVSDSSESDITLIVSGGTMLFNTLQPVHGAKASVIRSEPVSQGRCAQSGDARSDRNIPDFPPGTFLCVLTNQGRFVRVRIDQVENPHKGATRVTVTILYKQND
jgi:hypothetical protein